jgi:hypothetical protein
MDFPPDRLNDGRACGLLHVLDRSPAVVCLQTKGGISAARVRASKWISRCQPNASCEPKAIWLHNGPECVRGRPIE